MADYDLQAYVAKSSAIMALHVYETYVFAFHAEGLLHV